MSYTMFFFGACPTSGLMKLDPKFLDKPKSYGGSACGYSSQFRHEEIIKGRF